MKKKALIIIPVIAIISALIAVFVLSGNKPVEPTSDGTASPSVSETSQPTEFNESQIAEILKNTAVISVYAPEGATVLLDGKEMPYSDAVDCYRIIDELSGKHTLTVSRHGYESFSKELDLDKEKNHEITVELKMKKNFSDDIKAQAEKTLVELIRICDNKSGDLSEFNFVNEEEKSNIQSTVYDVIYELDVDTEEYTTGNLEIIGIKADTDTNLITDTLTSQGGTKGSAVKFTVEYSYSWQWNSNSYQNSGVDTSTANCLVMLDNIDGVWYLRELFLPLRKSHCTDTPTPPLAFSAKF